MKAKPYRIEWRPMAREDLREVVRYIAKDNPTRAKSFGQELRDKTKLLSQHPELGRKRRPGLPDWLRGLVVHSNHIVFYRVLDEARIVETVRVKHAAEQIPQVPERLLRASRAGLDL